MEHGHKPRHIKQKQIKIQSQKRHCKQAKIRTYENQIMDEIKVYLIEQIIIAAHPINKN